MKTASNFGQTFVSDRATHFKKRAFNADCVHYEFIQLKPIVTQPKITDVM